MRIRYFLFSLIPLLPIGLGAPPAGAAPMHPAAVAARHAAGDTCVWNCPSGVGDLWARVSARASAPAMAPGFLAANQTFADTDNKPDTLQVLALLVQFQIDAVTTTTDTGRFPSGDTTTEGNFARLMMDRIDTYYRRVSYGKLALKWTVADTLMVTLSQTMDAYSTGSNLLDDMIRETLTRVDTWINFKIYDAVVVLHAGVAKQLVDVSGNIPAQLITTGISSSPFNPVFTDSQTNDTVSMAVICALRGTTVSGETVTMMGTVAHELGHTLGLPDMYNTNVASLGIGKWGIMGTGNYLGSPQGDSPAWMDAWCREYLNWADTIVLDSTAALASFDTRISRAEDDSKIFKIYPKTSTKTEYFLLEDREPTVTGIDTAPGVGLLIYHVDNTVGSVTNNNINATNNNTATDHGRVHLEAADGGTASTISGLGDAGDPWPGSSSVTGFGDNSTPNSRGYGDTIARFSIKNIAMGSSVTFTMDFSDVNVTTALTVKYPSSCLLGRLLSPWPAAARFARVARDRMLNFSLGRKIIASPLP